MENKPNIEMQNEDRFYWVSKKTGLPQRPSLIYRGFAGVIPPIVSLRLDRSQRRRLILRTPICISHLPLVCLRGYFRQALCLVAAQSVARMT